MARAYSVGLVGESNYQDAIRGVREGERVWLHPEPDNPHDPRAVAVRDESGQTIGYVPRDSWLTGAIIDEGKGSRAVVQSIEGGDAGRPSLGVVLSVELGEKGAPVAPPTATTEPPGTELGRKIGKGCAAVVIALVALIVVMAIIDPKPSSPSSQTSAIAPKDTVEMPSDEDMMASSSDSTPEPDNDPGISAAEFAQLRNGMSYEEAVSVIGGPGELSSESNMAGYRTVMYSWKAEGAFNIGGNANAMFQNDKLVSKAQFGLR